MVTNLSTEWFITSETNRFTIKRYSKSTTGKKVERYPRSKYKHLELDRNLLTEFVIRLNGRDPAEIKARDEHQLTSAFLGADLLYRYRTEHLRLHIPSEKDSNTAFHYLTKYGIEWFVRRKLVNPLHWHLAQDEWANYLLKEARSNRGTTLSTKVVRAITFEMNRFLKYLHKQRPSEFPPLQIDSLFSKAALKLHDAIRKRDNNVRDASYLSRESFKLLEEKINRDKLTWGNYVLLAYKLGLRRNETLGLELVNIRRGHVSIERQFTRMDGSRAIYSPLKNRGSRKVPYWFISAEEVYHLVNSVGQVHPDTLSRKFSELTQVVLGTSFVFHELRKAFITNALSSGYKHEDVRLAAGHANIKTTLDHYALDSRGLEESVYIPNIN